MTIRARLLHLEHMRLTAAGAPPAADDADSVDAVLLSQAAVVVFPPTSRIQVWVRALGKVYMLEADRCVKGRVLKADMRTRTGAE